MKLNIKVWDRVRWIIFIVKPSYSTLIASVSAWIASIVLIMVPTIGMTTRVYPPNPTPNYLFVLLGVTTCFASLYAALLGYKLIKG